MLYVELQIIMMNFLVVLNGWLFVVVGINNKYKMSAIIRFYYK